MLDRGNAVRFGGMGWVDEPVRSDGLYLGGVRLLTARQMAIADPSGGATQDGEARLAIASILAALRVHGMIEA